MAGLWKIENGDRFSKHRARARTSLSQKKWNSVFWNTITPPFAPGVYHFWQSPDLASVAFGLGMSTMGSEFQAKSCCRRLLICIIMWPPSCVRPSFSLALLAVRLPFARRDLSSEPDVPYYCGSQESRLATGCAMHLFGVTCLCICLTWLLWIFSELFFDG